MNRNILCFCAGIILYSGLTLYAQEKASDTIERASPKHGRIEKSFDDNQGKTLKFISPEGNERKRVMEYGRTKKVGEKWVREFAIIGETLPDTGFVMVEKRTSEHTNDPRYERDSAEPGEYWDEEIELLNSDGETVAKKAFRTYPGEDLLTTSYWKNEFSKEGRHFFVYYRDEKGGGNVEVYSVTGEKLAYARAEGEIENIEISPEGSLVAGYLYLLDEKGANQKHIFLLESATNKSKVIKATGIINERIWGASFIFFNPNPVIPTGTVRVFVGVRKNYSEETVLSWGGYLNFSEIPEDLSALLVRGNKK